MTNEFGDACADPHEVPVSRIVKEFTVPAALAASVALVVTGLATVGASGDGLTRAVRNHPWWMSILVAVALISGLILVLIARSGTQPKDLRVREIVFLSLLVAAAVTGAFVGAYSISAREAPAVSLKLSTAAESTILTVSAQANDQRTNEQMIVQVLGLGEVPATGPSDTTICKAGKKTLTAPKLKAAGATTLLWQSVGPDLNGSRQVSTKVVVPTGTYRAFCSGILMPNRKSNDGRNASVAYIFAPVAAKPLPTASATPTTTR